MIGNIIEYVHSYGYFDFDALAFSAVDALVLGQFVYLKINGLAGGFEEEAAAVTLREMAEDPRAEQMFADPRWEENNRALFKEMCESRRFGTMQCIFCEERTCVEDETQFMAVTCILSDGSVKILYRGTDETIVGWKEDFNMAFQFPIPGQDAGLQYLERAAGRVCGKIDLIGHSKGGNLAVYAAMYASEETKERIGTIYNLDGPGFRSEVYRMGYFETISDRIVKIIPRSSIVGMILEDHGQYKVVASSNVGFLQHDPFSWLIDRIDFVYADQIDEPHRIMDESLNEWISSLSEEEVASFVNTLYQIVSASEATDLIGFTKNWTKSFAGMAGAIQHMDEKTKSNMYRIMRRLAGASREKLKEETGSFFQNKIEGLTHQLTGKEGKQ